MPTIASLNVLLSLNPSGFRSGIGNAIRQIQQFNQQVQNLSQQHNVSQNLIRKAISETSRTRSEAMRAERAENAAIYRENERNRIQNLRQATQAAKQEQRYREQLHKEELSRAAEFQGRVDAALKRHAVEQSRLKKEELSRAAEFQGRVDAALKRHAVEQSRLKKEEASRAAEFQSRAQAAIQRHAAEQQRINKEEARVAANKAKIAEGARKILAKGDAAMLAQNTRAIAEGAKAQVEHKKAAAAMRQRWADAAKGIGNVGNTIGTTFSRMREVMIFAGSRVASGVREGFFGLGLAIGGLIHPTERVGTAITLLAAGGGMALGKLVGTVGDVLGTVVNAVGIGISGLLSGLLNMLPMIGPILGGIASALGGIVSAAGAAFGALARVAGEIIGGIAGVGGVVLGGLTSALINVGAAAVGTSAQFEQMEMAFEVMTGLAERAKAVLRDIYQFASVTPFEIKDVTKATQQLTAVGIKAEDAFQMVKRLGNVAAAMPDSMAENLNRVVRALAQMHAKGTVQAEEMTRQLANAGIPAWQALADKIGITVPEAIERARAGMISARTAIEAILELATSPRFAAMQARQAQTLFGLWSTLRDNVTLIMKDLGDRIGKAFDLKGAVLRITEFFAYLKNSLVELQPIISLVGAAFQVVTDAVILLGKWIVDLAKRWGVALGGMGANTIQLKFVVINAIEAMLVGIVKFANQMQVGVGNAVVVLADVFHRLVGVHGAVGLAFLAVGMAASTAWGAKVGGPLGALAALATWVLMTEKMRQGIISMTKGAQTDIGGMRAFGERTAAVDPNRGVQGIRDIANALRQVAVVGPVATGIVRGLAFAVDMVAFAMEKLGVKWQLPLKFGELSKGIQDMVNNTRSPPQEFREEMRKVQFAAKELAPQAAMLMGVAFANQFGLMTREARNVATAIRAINRSAGEAFVNLRKKWFGGSSDTPALEMGSREAGAAINRALNAARGEGMTVAQELRIIRELEKRQAEWLERIGQEVLGLGGALGVADGI